MRDSSSCISIARNQRGRHDARIMKADWHLLDTCNYRCDDEALARGMEIGDALVGAA
jgi:hypothetical protein